MFMPNSLALPAIVVVAFNRPDSLKRILNSLDNADYQGYENVPLIISIDKSNCTEVIDVAKEFTWKYGSKQVISHESNLGLKRHIISCGDLTEKYGSVIVLEDDLFVSSAFYDYAVKAMHFYQDAENISGIALYSYDFNDWVRLPFIPIHDGYDNYFYQCATSWGQLWTHKQWKGFKQWYAANADLVVDERIAVPPSVIKWPQSSWKKYFVTYMVLNNKYFVYPRTSLSTNCGDLGTHHKMVCLSYKVPLLLKTRPFKFSHFEESNSIYDVFYELEPKCLKSLNPDLKEFDFECDLYGSKRLSDIKSKYLLSIRECESAVRSYSTAQIPHELNIIFDERGDFFNLAETSKFSELKEHKVLFELRNLTKDMIDMPRCRSLYSQIFLERSGRGLRSIKRSLRSHK